MNYDEYKIFDWSEGTAVSELDFEGAKARHDHFMTQVDQRTVELQKLVGKQYVLDRSEASLQCLNDFVWKEALQYGKTHSQILVDGNEMVGDSGLTLSSYGIPPSKLWRSIASDCGIYMVEMLQQHSSHLKWVFGPYRHDEIGKQYPQVTGFKNVKYKKYSVSTVYLIERYVSARLQGKENHKVSSTAFVKMYGELEAEL